MNYEQNIPFYISKFKEFPWKIYESNNYIFHVGTESLAEKDIEFIKARQESAFAKIIDTLKISAPSQKIIYYFYSSREQKEKLMGDGWFGQSIYNEFTIHAIYNEKDQVLGEHEDTHLLTLQMGLPISLFQEGLAEFMTGKSMFGNEHNNVLNDGMNKGLSINIQNLMCQQGWLDTPDEEAEFYYSVAGSFIRYVFNILDLEKFKKLYFMMNRENGKTKNAEIFKSVVGETISDIETKWLNFIVH